MPYEKAGNEVRCIAEEVPFEIPDSWEWVRLNESVLYTTDYVANGSFATLRENVKNYKTENYAILVKTQDFSNNFTRNLTYIDKQGYEFLSKSKLYGGELMLSNIGASIGKAFIIPQLDKPMSLAPNSIIVKCINDTMTQFIKYLILSPFGQDILKNFTAGTAMPKFSKTQLRGTLLPFPPLAEQQRIVDKLKELEPYIQEYDIAYEKIEKLNNNFSEQLKKSILQDAVQGKLVPQNPNDEPASVLIERIREEKQKLIQEKKIKKDKNESYIFRRDNSHYEKIGSEERCIDDEIPFDIPDNWEWVRLKNILEIARGGSPRPIQAFLTTKENGIPWIKIGDTNKGEKYINSTKEFIVPEGIHKSRMVYKGDFLLTNSMSFGRPYILNIDGCIHDGWLVLNNLYNAFYIDYLYYLLSSTYVYYQFCNSVSGAVVKNLNSDKVANALIPLPPLAEQQRIVEKIEQLLPEIKTLQK